MSNLGIRFIITGVAMQGQSIVGYELVSCNHGAEIVDKEQVYKLAANGYINNAEVVKVRGKETLRGKLGTDLAKIRRIQVKV